MKNLHFFKISSYLYHFDISYDDHSAMEPISWPILDIYASNYEQRQIEQHKWKLRDKTKDSKNKEGYEPQLKTKSQPIQEQRL